MIDIIKQEVEASGDKAEIISVKDLQYISQDIEDIKNTGLLNDFQKFIVNDIYNLNFPKVSFEIKSIIIVATPCHVINLIFNKNGKKVSTVLPPTYGNYTTAPKRVEEYLKKLMNLHGFHICAAPKLPHKLLAVRSGLSNYGRNNISYIDGMGSSYMLVAFYSDLPCEREGLHEISQMDICHNCTLCIQNCPTKAILEDRFLIDNQRCLTYYNEAGGWDFPEWIEESAHNSLYGCIQCQIVCPCNKEQFNSITQTIEFSEQETEMLLEKNNSGRHTFELKEKIEKLCMEGFLSAIPRNLKILFERE